MLPVSEGQDLLYSAVLEQSRIILLSLVLGVSGLEGVPGLGPNVAVLLARYLSLPAPPSACGSL